MEEKAVEAEQASTIEQIKKVIRQDREFSSQVLRGFPDIDAKTKQDWISNPDLVKRQLAKFAISPFLVKVDRSVKPPYPDEIIDLIHPEWECHGPVEFHLREDLELWRHEEQVGNYYTQGQVIYQQLDAKGLLKYCLNLQDGLAIQETATAAFLKSFNGAVIPLWKSVARDVENSLRVPYLFGNISIGLRWGYMYGGYNSNHPTLMFKENRES